MPNTTPPARYDSPWKAALTHAFREFIDFFFADLSPEIDWMMPPHFRDKELAGISFGGATDGVVADKLVEVRLRDGNVGLVLIHVEVQAQRDTAFGRRVFDYNYRIFKEHNRLVSSLVLLADNFPNWRPKGFHYEVLGTVMGISFPVAKLLDYAARTDELLVSDNPFALVTLAHLRTQQARRDPEALYAAKWQLTKLLYQHGWNKERIIVFFKVINWMMALPDAYQQRYWRAIRQLEKELNMEWIDPLEQSFIDKGREQGRKEEALAILERQLIRRFGPLPKTAQSKLAKASLPKLRAWSDALLDAPSLKQVFDG